MSCLGNFIPPLGHSVIAFVMACSSVGAQDMCNCSTFGISSGFLPASRAPSSNLAKTFWIFSALAPTVMMPSQNLPVFFAVIGPAVAT